MRVILFLFLLLTGCSGIQPNCPPPNLESVGQYYSRSLANENLKNFIQRTTHKAIPQKWGIEELTLVAIYYNPDLELARSQLELNMAAEITAAQIPNPSVSLGPGYDGTLPSPVFIITPKIPIETAGKRQIRIARAKNLTMSVRFKLASSVWETRGQIINALIDIISSKKLIKIYQEEAYVQKKIIDLFTEREARGQIPTIFANQVQIKYQESLFSAKEMEKQAKDAVVRLARALGVPVCSLDGIQINEKEIENAKVFLKKIHYTPKENNDLLATLSEYHAAHHALQLEIAKRIPDIELGPSFEWSEVGNIILGEISATLPIFNNNEGPIAEALAKRKITADNFNILQANLIEKLETIQSDLQPLKQKIKISDKLISDQRQKLKNLKSTLHLGDASKLPILISESEIYIGLRTREEAMLQLLKNKASLERILQQPQFGSGYITYEPCEPCDRKNYE